MYEVSDARAVGSRAGVGGHRKICSESDVSVSRHSGHRDRDHYSRLGENDVIPSSESASSGFVGVEEFLGYPKVSPWSGQTFGTAGLTESDLPHSVAIVE